MAVDYTGQNWSRKSNDAGAVGNSIALTVSGATAGDLLVAVIVCSGTGILGSVTGWDAQTAAATASPNVRLLTRTATGTTADNFSLSLGGFFDWGIQVSEWTDWDSLIGVGSARNGSSVTLAVTPTESTSGLAVGFAVTDSGSPESNMAGWTFATADVPPTFDARGSGISAGFIRPCIRTFSDNTTINLNHSEKFAGQSVASIILCVKDAVGGGGPTVSPLGKQSLNQSYQAIAASRLNGVLQ